MTTPLGRRLLEVAFALVVCALWSPLSFADVVKLTTGQEIEGTVKGTTPRGLVIEVKGRQRTIAQRLVRGIIFGPTRPSSPSSSTARAPVAVAASAQASSESPVRSAEPMTPRTEAAAPAAPAPAPVATDPERSAPAAAPVEPASPVESTPEPAAPAKPVGPVPPPPQVVASVETVPPTAPAPAPPTTPRDTIAADEPSAEPPTTTAASDDFKIGPEDLLDIVVWNNTAISRTVPVRPDGKISLPLVNDVQAAGLTPMQLRDVLVKKLTAYMPRPELSVIVREVHSFKVSVIGEVTKPGQYELKSRSTVLDAIALAGGFTAFASPSRIVLLRSNGKTTTRIPFNYKKAISSELPPKDLFLLPGDIVVVP